MPIKGTKCPKNSKNYSINLTVCVKRTVSLAKNLFQLYIGSNTRRTNYGFLHVKIAYSKSNQTIRFTVMEVLGKNKRGILAFGLVLLFFSCKKQQQEPCLCTKEYRPVCAGGQQFSNPCLAECAGYDPDEIVALGDTEQTTC